MSRAEAQKLINNGRAIIPLFPNQKKNHDSDILTKRYKSEETKEGDNLGINLLLSGKVISWTCGLISSHL